MVGVVDATGHLLAGPFAERLRTATIAARVAGPLELLLGFELLVVLLPVDPRKLSDEGLILLAELEQLIADDALRQECAPMVTVWVVDAAERRKLAGAIRGHNHAGVLLGSFVRRNTSPGQDIHLAVRRRSRVIAQLARATPVPTRDNQSAVVDLFEELDPGVLHGLVCRHPQARGPGGVIEWASSVGVVGLRLSDLIDGADGAETGRSNGDSWLLADICSATRQH